MSASKFNWSAAALWVVLAPAPFVLFVLVMVIAEKAPGMAAAYSLAPYAVVVLAVGYLIKGKARWRSWRGVVGAPFALVGGCALGAILVNGIMFGL